MSDHETPEIKIKLTPIISHSLSEKNSQQYTDLLLNHLRNRSLLIPDYLQRLTNLSLFNPQAITLDPRFPISSASTTTPEITLGTIPMLPAHLSARFFEGESFRYIDQVSWQLIHELTHKAFSYARLELSQESSARMQVTQLFNLAKQLRDSHPNHGLSAHASDGYNKSQGPIFQATEDVIELTTMFLYNPDSFDRYTNLIADPKSAGLIAKYGVASLDRRQAEQISRLTKAWVTEFSQQ